MVCIYCGTSTMVTNSRHQKRVNHVWRRRRCTTCAATFTTHETPDFSTALMVRYTSKVLEPFSCDILFISIYQALKHRPAAVPEADALTTTIISQLVPVAAQGVVGVEEIVATTADTLGRFDHAAATMYLAYHTAGRR